MTVANTLAYDCNYDCKRFEITGLLFAILSIFFYIQVLLVSSHTFCCHKFIRNKFKNCLFIGIDISKVSFVKTPATMTVLALATFDYVEAELLSRINRV